MESVSASISVFDKKKNVYATSFRTNSTQGFEYVVGLIPTPYFRILPYLP